MLNAYRNASTNGIQFRYWLLWELGLIERFLMGRIIDDHRHVLFAYTATNGRYISIVAVRWSFQNSKIEKLTRGTLNLWVCLLSGFQGCMQDYMLQEMVCCHISTGPAHIEVNSRLRNLPISLTFTCPTLT